MEPKMEEHLHIHSALLHLPSTPNRRCYKPYDQDNKQSFNILVLGSSLWGLRGPTFEVEEASELGEWLLPIWGYWPAVIK